MRRGITARGLATIFILSGLLTVPTSLWLLGVPAPGSKLAPSPPSIAFIQTISELATCRIHISDSIEGENRHYKGKWALHGEAVLGVDLSKILYIRTQPEKKEAVLSLPPPCLISTKVDHERSDEIYVQAVAWVHFSSRKALRDEVWKQADRKLERLALQPAHIERARSQAERALQDLFKGVGWKVRFEWTDTQQAESRLGREQFSGQVNTTATATR